LRKWQRSALLSAINILRGEGSHAVDANDLLRRPAFTVAQTSTMESPIATPTLGTS